MGYLLNVLFLESSTVVLIGRCSLDGGDLMSAYLLIGAVFVSPEKFMDYVNSICTVTGSS
jgi:hypothetical protein